MLTCIFQDHFRIVAVAADARPRIEAILGEAARVTKSGLVTLERARMLTGDLGLAALPCDLHETTKLTIYLGRQERVYRVPAFVAVCDLLHRRGVAGATALLGVDGTAHGQRQRAAFFGRNAQTPKPSRHAGRSGRHRQLTAPSG